MKTTLPLLIAFLFFTSLQAQQKKEPNVKPTIANVAYGSHKFQIFDFYQAKSDKPTPLVFFIHGGAWTHGDKVGHLYKAFKDLNPFLDNGISVVSVNYRLIKHAKDIYPSVIVPIDDITNALRFVRANATKYNIDKNNIVFCGGSAGACSSLIIGLRGDLKDKHNKDILLKQSTLPKAIFALHPQTTLDPVLVKKWIPNNTYGGHAFNLDKVEGDKKATFQNFLNKRNDILEDIEKYSPYSLVSKNAPPIFLYYSYPPRLKEKQIKDAVHSTNYGVYFKQKCDSIGAVCTLIHKDNGYTKTRMQEDIIEMLLNEK